MAGIVVQRIKHNDPIRMIESAENSATLEALRYGVKRAKVYVPVKTGRLKDSIKVMSDKAFGSIVRYASYVEKGTSFMRARNYLKKAAIDVSKAFPKMFDKGFRRLAK